MNKLRELYDMAHPNNQKIPTISELMEWAAEEISKIRSYDSGERFTEEGVLINE